jgi:hypothetical protein
MKDLSELIEWAKTVKMTPEQLAEQRISFVYGNCKIENDNVTRGMVETAARKIGG